MRILELFDRVAGWWHQKSRRIGIGLGWLWHYFFLVPVDRIESLFRRLTYPLRRMAAGIGYGLSSLFGFLPRRGTSGIRRVARPFWWLADRYWALRNRLVFWSLARRRLTRRMAARYWASRKPIVAPSKRSEYSRTLTRWLAARYWACWDAIPRVPIPWRWLGKPFRKLHWGYILLMEAIERSPRVKRWLWPLRMIGRATLNIYDFAEAWLFTREYRLLWGAIPAVLLALPLAYCAVRMPFYTNLEKARHYLNAARDAWNDKRYAEAKLFYRRVGQLGLDPPRIQMERILGEWEETDPEVAYQRIQRLAPDDKPGYARAHLWIAHALINNKIKVPRQQRNRLVETHLNHALEADTAGEVTDQAQSLLAAYYLLEQRFSDALPLLRQLSVKHPDQRVRLGQVYALLGQPRQALEEAQRAVAEFTTRASRGPITAGDYYYWGAAYELLGDMDRAIATLETGLQAHPEAEILTDGLTTTYAVHASRLAMQGSESTELLACIRRGLHYDPQSVALLNHLALLGQGATEAAREARQEIETLIDQDRLPGDVHITLAEFAFRAKDFTTARARYLDAHRLKPENHVLANNLAWLLSHTEPADLKQALELADRAVASDPSNPHFRETRGQVLLRLARWQDAATDLERAANGIPGQPDIHDSLAQVYEAMGKPEPADAHRQTAQRLRGRL